MTPDEARALKVEDRVRYRNRTGTVKMIGADWVDIRWDTGSVFTADRWPTSGLGAVAKLPDPEKVIADLGLTGFAADSYRVTAMRPDLTLGELMRIGSAMLSPTPDMIVAGDEAIIAALNEHPQDPQMKNGTPAARFWLAMVNAALAAGK